MPIKYSAPNGKTVIVARFEHTMILVGYDEKFVFAVDAYSGKLNKYTKRSFLQSWEVLGNIAITGSGKLDQGMIEITKIEDSHDFHPPK